MSLYDPGLAHRAPDRERDLMRTIVDCGPLTGRYLMAQEARERSAHGCQSGTGRVGLGVRPAVVAACRRLGAARVALGLRRQGSSPVAHVLALPGEQNAV